DVVVQRHRYGARVRTVEVQRVELPTILDRHVLHRMRAHGRAYLVRAASARGCSYVCERVSAARSRGWSVNHTGFGRSGPRRRWERRNAFGPLDDAHAFAPRVVSEHGVEQRRIVPVERYG